MKNVVIYGYNSSVHNDIPILCLSGISGIGLCLFRIWYRMKTPLVLVLLYKVHLHPLSGPVSSFGCIVMFNWNLKLFRPLS